MTSKHHDDRHREAYLEQVVEAAYLHTREGCYFVGPFASRVSFKSQQTRVLDLIEGLRLSGRIAEGKNVAVIGGGLSGMTAATALRGEKCKVTLFEKEAPLFHRQREASHRIVHPTISRWPEDRLEHTTNFGFLDWYVAPASKIRESIVTEWDALVMPALASQGVINRVEANVQGLSFNQSNGRVFITAMPPHTESYDIVIVTTGFANEREVKGLTSFSYWKLKDQLDKWDVKYLKKHWSSGKKVLVSGCGDGGLIDCLRLIHGDFRDGWLAIELAEMCRDAVMDSLVRAEKDAVMAMRSIQSTRRFAQQKTNDVFELEDVAVREDREHTAYLEAKDGEMRYTRALEAAYEEALKLIPDEAKAIMEASIKLSGVSISGVLLVSMQACPFVPNAAPIHKLMLKYAMDMGYVNFKSGRVICGDNGHPKLRGANSQIDLGDIPYIIRHGATANLEGIGITREEQAGLGIRQLLLADYIDTNSVRRSHPPENYAQKDVERSAYASIRHAGATELIETIMPGHTVRTSDDRQKFIVYPINNHRINSDNDVKRYGLKRPETIFGIDTELGETPVGIFL